MSLWRRERGIFPCAVAHYRLTAFVVHVGDNSPPDCSLPKACRLSPSLFESQTLQTKNLNQKWFRFSVAEREGFALTFCKAVASISFFMLCKMFRSAAKNSPLDCFFNALVRIPLNFPNKKRTPYWCPFGGERGIRTLVCGYA